MVSIMIKTFRRKIRRINKSVVVTIPKYIIEGEKLTVGQEHDFIIRIPDKEK